MENNNFDFFLSKRKEIAKIILPILSKFEVGELFLEEKKNLTVRTTNGIVNSIEQSLISGFAMRGYQSKQTFFISSDVSSIEEIERIINKIKIMANIKEENQDYNITDKTEHKINSIKEEFVFDNPDNHLKVIKEFIGAVKEKSIGKNPKISTNQTKQRVLIIRNDGQIIYDVRPYSIISCSVVGTDKNKENFSVRKGQQSRNNLESLLYFKDKLTDSLMEQFNNLKNAQRIEGGKMDVILGNGDPGVLIHECVGHPLEADLLMEGSSQFTDKIGKRVANEQVNIYDNGTLKDERGGLNFDDEGSESQNTLLVEKGILKKLMCDRIYGKKTKFGTTSNCRRENYFSIPCIRMTNTYLDKGTYSVEEMIKSVEKGIYITAVDQGQVNSLLGTFSFGAKETFLIEKGKIICSLKNCTISGLCKDVLENIKMVGNDFELDQGTGFCGKNGQYVPVSCSQPSVLITDLIIG